MATVDLLVLAGGRGSRLGGRDKAALTVAGRALLDRVLDAAPLLGGRVVVVGDTTVPEGVLRTLEDPPDGGPVAGIAAGLAALGPGAAWVAVVAVDQPGAAAALAALVGELARELEGRTGDDVDDVDAIGHVDAEGHRQWLLALYRRDPLEASLAALGAARHTSVRRLVADLRWRTAAAGAEHLGDVDTWADAQGWERRLARARMTQDHADQEG